MNYLKIISLFAIAVLQSVQPLTEAPDGSVCFNNCSGHGRCEDYTCYCDLGYVGDDCSHTFAADEENIVPILTAGDFNLTRKNFTSALIKHKYVLVGFSSPTCHKVALLSEMCTLMHKKCTLIPFIVPRDVAE